MLVDESHSNLSINLSIYQSINQSIYQSIYLSINLSIHPSIHSSIHPSIHLYIYLSYLSYLWYPSYLSYLSYLFYICICIIYKYINTTYIHMPMKGSLKLHYCGAPTRHSLATEVARPTWPSHLNFSKTPATPTSPVVFFVR